MESKLVAVLVRKVTKGFIFKFSDGSISIFEPIDKEQCLFRRIILNQILGPSAITEESDEPTALMDPALLNEASQLQQQPEKARRRRTYSRKEPLKARSRTRKYQKGPRLHPDAPYWNSTAQEQKRALVSALASSKTRAEAAVQLKMSQAAVPLEIKKHNVKDPFSRKN